MTLAIDQLVHSRARLVVDGRTLDRDELVRALRRADALTGVVRVPARSPLDALIGVGAAWRGGGLPIPDRVATRPTPVASATSPQGALGLGTSGSTEAPRVAVFSAEALVWSVQAIAASLGLQPDDRVGMIAPSDHGFGLVGLLLAGLHAGATVVDASGAFAAERASAVDRGRCTVIGAVPSVLDGVVAALPGPARARLRQIGSAGGPLSPTVAARLCQACPAAVVLNQYGCTEAGPRLTACPSTSPHFAAGAVGPALPGVALAIVDGEVVFASPGQMSGYLDAPEATRAASIDVPGAGSGWRTRDLGRWVDGVLFLDGRADDRCKLNGEWVALDAIARAVESAGARRAFATLVPRHDRPEGRLTVVYEGPRVALVDLLPSLPAGLAPRLVHVDALPSLPSGKIDRRTARAMGGA